MIGRDGNGAWLRCIDLSEFTARRIELPRGAGAFSIGRAAGSDLRIVSPNVSNRHCRLVSDGGPWRLEDSSLGGLFIDGEKVAPGHRLKTGDAFAVHDQLLVFSDRHEARAAELEAAIDQDPDDAARVLVWADWLIDQGDPLGEDLVRARCGGPMLEGLERHLDSGRLELVWRNGLVHTARVRTTRASTPRSWELLARLVRVRAARWLRELVVDSSAASTDPDPASLETSAMATMRVLLAAELPRLERLSLGHTTQDVERSSFFQALVSSLGRRFPAIDTARLLGSTRRAWLELLHVPPGLDFHHDGPNQQSIPLALGVWVGSSRQGTLRAVSPGTIREGLETSFVVRIDEAWWALEPGEPTLTLNGHRAAPVRLLPGDVIEDARGMRYRFNVA